MAEPTLGFKAGLLDLLQTSRLTDFTINCGPHSHMVHKAIISAHSKYFELACRRFKEGETGVITLKALRVTDEEGLPPEHEAELDQANSSSLRQDKHAPNNSAAVDGDATTTSAPDIDQCDEDEEHMEDEKEEDDDDDDVCDCPAAIKLMIDFFYTFDYYMPGEFVIIHARVSAAAVKYQIPDLKDLAAQKFQTAVAQYWNAPSFSEAARIAYTTTPEDVKELREIVAVTLLKHDKLLDKPEIENIVREIPGLSFELLKRKRSSATGVGFSSSSICSQCARRMGDEVDWGLGELSLKKKKKGLFHTPSFECECGRVYGSG